MSVSTRRVVSVHVVNYVAEPLELRVQEQSDISNVCDQKERVRWMPPSKGIDKCG